MTHPIEKASTSNEGGLMPPTTDRGRDYMRGLGCAGSRPRESIFLSCRDDEPLSKDMPAPTKDTR